MRVTVAESAGYCAGVARAVHMVEQALDRGERLVTLGPLIHNPQVLSELARRGARAVGTLAEVPEGYTVALRSHGVGPSVYEELASRGLAWLDTTCPHVARVHTIVRQAGEDACVLIIGDRAHAEIRGVIGHCTGKWRVFASAQELERFYRSLEFSVETSYILVSQTTLNRHEWQKCVDITKKVCTNTAIFDTICSAATLRQRDAAALSRQCDAMVVIGGRNSSNTAKLVQVCAEFGPVVHIETVDELSRHDFLGKKHIGITAGASTPAFIIKEVQETMSELENLQDEMSFEEMLEQSFKTIYSKEKVTGLVTSVSANEIAVDIGTKHAGYVPLSEYTDDPNAKLEELVKVGDQLDLMVLRVNDMEGTAMLSKKRLDAIAGFEKIADAEQADQTVEGVVVDIVKGGVIALAHGVRVFIPASQATLSRNQPLEPLKGQTVQFKILETNRSRRRAVGSIRAVLKDQKKLLEEKFWQEVEIGKTYQGTVKSLTSYGAFVDLGGVDGMIHISELSWSRIKAPSEVVSVGDPVEVYVKDIDTENKKISLGYKKDEDNPWVLLRQQVQAGDVVKVKVVSMTPFGAFAQVIPGVDGLIHISQISNVRIGKPSDVLAVGQDVDVKVTDIDYEKKRVSLSIRALLAPEPDALPELDSQPPVVMEFGPPQKTPARPPETAEEVAVPQEAVPAEPEADAPQEVQVPAEPVIEPGTDAPAEEPKPAEQE